MRWRGWLASLKTIFQLLGYALRLGWDDLRYITARFRLAFKFRGAFRRKDCAALVVALREAGNAISHAERRQWLRLFLETYVVHEVRLYWLNVTPEIHEEAVQLFESGLYGDFADTVEWRFFVLGETPENIDLRECFAEVIDKAAQALRDRFPVLGALEAQLSWPAPIQSNLPWRNKR